MNLMILIQLYLAFLIVVLLHEFGHMPKKINMIRWFPLPEGAAMSARFRYGGLIVNLAIIYLIFITQPQWLFLQMIGLVAWIHFIFYTFIGSFNYEPKIPKKLQKFFIFDDIPNELAWFFVPLGIVVFGYFYNYYSQIFTLIL